MKEKYVAEKAILEWKEMPALAWHNHHSQQQDPRKTEILDCYVMNSSKGLPSNNVWLWFPKTSVLGDVTANEKPASTLHKEN